MGQSILLLEGCLACCDGRVGVGHEGLPLSDPGRAALLEVSQRGGGNSRLGSLGSLGLGDLAADDSLDSGAGRAAARCLAAGAASPLSLFLQVAQQALA